MQILIKNKNTLLCDEFEFKCCVGKNGISINKKEGDNKSLRGTYALGPVFYRKDRLPNFFTKLKKIEIKKSMGWCDDINSRFYNQLIRINKNIKHEKLFRKSKNYDILIPIKYNYSKPKKNKGSALFLHLTNDYKKTQGCIALRKKDMLILLRIINKNTTIKIT